MVECCDCLSLALEPLAALRIRCHLRPENYLGLEDKKTRALLNMAVRLDGLPKMKDAFRKGDIPWTKAREAVKAATQETDAEWVKK